MSVTIRSLLFFIFILVVVTLVPVEVQASTYFVATNGSDANVGTSAAPWRTIRYAVSRLRAGDLLYIRGGTYAGVGEYD